MVSKAFDKPIKIKNGDFTSVHVTRDTINKSNGCQFRGAMFSKTILVFVQKFVIGEIWIYLLGNQFSENFGQGGKYRNRFMIIKQVWIYLFFLKRGEFC